MSDLTPPPERDLSPERRQAIRAALHSTEPGRRRTPILAAAAVAAVVAAGIAVPRLLPDDRPQPADRPETPSVTKPRTTPSRSVAPAVDPVRICRQSLVDYGAKSLGRATSIPLRVTGRWGATLILTDTKSWVGCDTARFRESGSASLYEPSRISPPSVSDSDAFAVSNLALQDRAGIYEHYWAAGVLPTGVARITYTFPDGVAKQAVVKDRFWLVEHLESKPSPPGRSNRDRPRITVELFRADGTVARNHRLIWGTQTCAHRNHGC